MTPYDRFESREFFMCLCQRTTLIGIPPTAWTTSFMQSLLSELSMFQDMTMYQWQVVHLVKYGTARYLLLFIVSYNHHMSMIRSFAGALSFHWASPVGRPQSEAVPLAFVQFYTTDLTGAMDNTRLTKI